MILPPRLLLLAATTALASPAVAQNNFHDCLQHIRTHTLRSRHRATTHMPTEKRRVSWAGARGKTPFLPPPSPKYAAARDGKGSSAIWNRMPDAFAPAATFLRGIGFKPGLPAAEEVFLPQN